MTKPSQSGATTLIIVIITSSILFTLAVFLIGLTANHQDSLLALQKHLCLSYFVDGCAEISTQNFFQTGTVPPSLTLPEGTCQAEIIASSSSQVDLRLTGIQDNISRSLDWQIRIATPNALIKITHQP